MKKSLSLALLVVGLSLTFPIYAQRLPVRFEKSWGPGTLVASETERGIIEDETDGKGNPDFLISPIKLKDFRGMNLYFDIKIDKLENFSGFEIRLGDEGFKNYYALSIPYFKDPEFNIVQDRHWQTYSFGLANAKVVGRPQEGFTQFGIYMQDNGKGPIDIAVRKIQFKPAPPTGYVSLTFDDGYSDQYRAAEIMHKYQFAGTAYVMPRQIGKPGYMDLKQLKELKTKYYWGISAHNAIPYTAFTPYALDKEINFTLDFLANNGFAATAHHLAYPMGRQDRDVVVPIVRKYFESARVAGGGVETLPPGDPLFLRTINVSGTASPEELVEVAKQAVDNGQWAILMFHHVVEQPKTSLEYRDSDFARLIELLAQAKVPVLPVDVVYSKFKSAMEAKNSAATLRRKGYEGMEY